jgi:hypothetical protein
MCKGVARDSEIIYWKVVRTYVTPHFRSAISFDMICLLQILTVFFVSELDVLSLFVLNWIPTISYPFCSRFDQIF